MNTYIRLNENEFWNLLVDSENPTTDSTNESINENTKGIFLDRINEGIESADFTQENGGYGGLQAMTASVGLDLLCSLPALDYMALSEEYGRAIVVNKAGGYCFLSEDDVITERIKSLDFPQS